MNRNDPYSDHNTLDSSSKKFESGLIQTVYHFQMFSLVTIFLTKISTGYIIEELPDEPVLEFQEPDRCQNEIEQLTKALKQCISNSKQQNYLTQMDSRGKVFCF